MGMRRKVFCVSHCLPTTMLHAHTLHGMLAWKKAYTLLQVFSSRGVLDGVEVGGISRFLPRTKIHTIIILTPQTFIAAFRYDFPRHWDQMYEEIFSTSQSVNSFRKSPLVSFHASFAPP